VREWRKRIDHRRAEASNIILTLDHRSIRKVGQREGNDGP
jgi:hypothetical protein